MDESYLARLKTEFTTDPKSKQPSTERTKNLKGTLLATVPKICPERARLYTQSWQETDGEPIVVRRAKALEKVLTDMTIFIRPGELIVGNHASDVRAAPLFPEFSVQFVLDELDGNPVRFDERPGEKFLVSEEDEKELREIARWWRGKTVTKYKRSLYPDDVYKAAYEVNAIDLTPYGEGGGSGHFIPGYPEVLKRGLNGIIKDAEKAIRDLNVWEPGALDRKSFLQASIIAMKAAIKFTKRFSSLAGDMAAKEEDVTRKEELLKIAEHCERVPASPARTFWEALQSLWFCHLITQIESNGHSMSYGRFDQYMYPFYQNDIKAGVLTPEQAVELIECLWIKTAEINKLRSWAASRVLMGYILFQNLTLGGQKLDGRSAVNDLSWLALEATANLKISQPSVSARYWNECPEDFLLKCCEVINIHRGGQPAMYNDEVIIPSQLAVGIMLDDAINYGIVGCVEPGEGGKSRRMGVGFLDNMLKVLELTLYNGRDPRTGIQLLPNPGNKDLAAFESFDELMAAFRHQREYYTRLGVIGINCVEKAYAELTPTPFVSSLVEDCIKRGMDIECGGAHYNTSTDIGIGMANVGNSLAAIRKLVFDDRKITGAQMKHALETNFDDMTTTPTGPEIRQMLLSAPKYGNDDDYVDLLVREATDYVVRDMPNYTDWVGGQYGTLLNPITANIPFGELCGATPDGRKTGSPVAEGCSPAQGTDVKGPTAAVKSVAKLDHVACDSGTLLNQKFNPTALQDISGLKKLASLIRTYFDLKGMHIQFNVVSRGTLREAQQNPEKYADLIVRVAGYSALFTALEPAVQNDIISRTEHGL
jgi:pyruvate formate-lyase/glycerol dehydratase family glycyl radical enzyme